MEIIVEGRYYLKWEDYLEFIKIISYQALNLEGRRFLYLSKRNGF